MGEQQGVGVPEAGHTWFDDPSRLRTILLAACALGFAGSLAGGVIGWSLASGALARMTFQAHGALLGRLSTLAYFGSLPVETFSAWWFLAVLVALVYWPRSALASLPTYVFVASVPALGYATWIWLSFAPFHSLTLLVSTVCLLTIVIATSMSDLVSLRHAASALLRDGAALAASPRAIVSLALVVLLPGSVVAHMTATGGPRRGSRNLADRAAFLQWYASQPRHAPALPDTAGAVRVIEFQDFQCGPCRAFFDRVRPAIPATSTVRLEVRDFPLDPLCNPAVARPIHPVACEAAAAVRVAARAGQGQEFERWLFDHQASLTSKTLRARLEEVGLLRAFIAGYDGALAEVTADVKLAAELRVQGTPTVFVNGVRLEDHTTVDWAIEHELATPK